MMPIVLHSHFESCRGHAERAHVAEVVTTRCIRAGKCNLADSYAENENHMLRSPTPSGVLLRTWLSCGVIARVRAAGADSVEYGVAYKARVQYILRPWPSSIQCHLQPYSTCQDIC